MKARADTAIMIWRAAAWACLIAIAFVTLAPIGFRPETGLPPSIERFAAFAIAGALFAAAYPRYTLVAATIVLGAAALFEVLQILEPTRHARVLDAAVKIGGGTIGVASGWLSTRLRPRNDS